MSYLSLILITINVENLDEVIMVFQKRELEKSILAGIDRLVHVLIDISCADGRQKDNLMEQAIQMVRDVTPHLLVLLGGKEEHLENLLRQLISQKLPPALALNSFGPLKRDLDIILTLAFFRDPEEATVTLPEIEPEEPPIEAATMTPVAIEVAQEYVTVSPQQETIPPPVVTTHSKQDLAILLKHFFPGTTIYQRYMLRSLQLDYYLPEEKLAVLISYPGVRTIPSLELLLKKEGITLLKLLPSELHHPALLTRKLASYR